MRSGAVGAGVDVTLALLGGVVFRVLAEVAVRARFEDLARQLGAQLVFERSDLVL